LAINEGYRATRGLFSQIDAGDDFRADQQSAIPTLLVSGDLDWSTPIENAQHALRFLDQGHLITVKGATHCPLNREEQLLSQRPDAVEEIRRFLDLDFEETSADDYLSTLPSSIELEPIEFAPVTGVSLYDEWLKRRMGTE
ncbi:MAG: alpha/beta hydrolase, partial [Pseudomonadota bacterium]